MVGLRSSIITISSLAFAFQFTVSTPSFAQVPTITSAPAAETKEKKPQIKEKAAPSKAKASSEKKRDGNILFEGYSKIVLGGVHIGYAVQRYEFDPAKKEFVSTSFLKTNALGGDLTESFKARATTDFRPVSYQYTGLVGGKTKTIDATFNKGVMVALVKDGTKTNTIRKDLPKGAFLSSFLVYMMLNSKEGIKPGTRYAYMAIAEEDAGIYPGEANVAKEEPYNGLKAFKIFNTFNHAQFASYVDAKGDVIATKSPAQGLSTELVKGQKEAVGEVAFNPSPITILFGTLPEGKSNVLSRQVASTPETTIATPAATTALPAEPAPVKINDTTTPPTEGTKETQSQ